MDKRKRGLALLILFSTVFTTPSFLSGMPKTLYRAGDIENARKNVEKHQWAKRVAAVRWESKTSFARKQDRQFFEEIIPELTPGRQNGRYCPACAMKNKDRKAPRYVLQWDISDPDKLKCSRCGTVFPNEKYPETGILEAPRMGQKFTYYQTPEERALPEDASPEEKAEHAIMHAGSPQLISFSDLIRFYKAQWAWNQALRMAKYYAITGDIGAAERTAWILDRFARVYPHYLWHNCNGSYADWPPSEVAAKIAESNRFPAGTVIHPYGLSSRTDEKGAYSTLPSGFFHSGRLIDQGSRADSGPLFDMAVAYDLVKDAVYPGGEKVIDGEMERRILKDLLEPGCRDMEHWDSLGNKGVGSFVLSAAVGLLLEQPERIRYAIGGLDRIMGKRYHFDGFYGETPSYAMHNYANNMWELPEMLDGYSDPPGYAPAKGGRIDNLDIFGKGRLKLAMLAMPRMLTPDLYLPAIGDTYYNSRLYPLFLEVLAAHYGSSYLAMLESLEGPDWGSEYSVWFRPHGMEAEETVNLPLRSEWFPGWHVGVLRGGRPDNTALYLVGNEAHWATDISHRHWDMLNLIYYAFGKELVSDRGYFSGTSATTPDGKIGRDWTRSTFAHNLVVVDESNQRGHHRSYVYGPNVLGWKMDFPRPGVGSNLELFGTAPGIEVIQASGLGAYLQCDEYRRTAALVNGPTGETYAVDFFRVSGGKTHQYTIHCQGELKNVKMGASRPKPAQLSPVWSYWLSDIREYEPATPSVFTWLYEDIRLDATLLNTSDTVKRVFVADAPGWRRYRSDEFDRPPIQQVLVENRAEEGEETLATVYATLIVPYKGKKTPVVSSRLLANDRKSGAVAVEVKFLNRTDYIISAKDYIKRSYGPITMSGHFGFISVGNNGEILQAYLLNGTLLQKGDTRIILPEPSTKAGVSSVKGNTIFFSKPLEAGLLPSAKYILSCGPCPIRDGMDRLQTGFEVEEITPEHAVVRDYPLQDCREATILHSAWTNPSPWWEN